MARVGLGRAKSPARRGVVAAGPIRPEPHEAEAPRRPMSPSPPPVGEEEV